MKHTKKLLTVLLALCLALGCVTPALACTGVYVGSGASANGSTYMARSEDYSFDHTKIFGVAPAADYPEDYIYEDAYGFTWPLGGHMYAYVFCKDSPEFEETMTGEDGNYIFEAYAAAGQNEKGVSITATVTIDYNEAAAEADPLVDGEEIVNDDGSTGLCEISIPTLVLGKAATAREGVELLAKIVDEKGAGECYSLMISDPGETWYYEQVSGHQYAAVKLPADKVSVQPNIPLMCAVDVGDTENVVASPNLVSLAREKGFLVTDGKGNIDVCKSYGEENSGGPQYTRYYQGVHYLNKAAAEALGWSVAEPAGEDEYGAVLDAGGKPIDGNQPDNGLRLLFDADHKLTTLEVLRLLGYRGDGLDGFDGDEDGVWSIGNEETAEAHVFEIRKDLPLGLTTLQWLAMGPAEFSVYLPGYSALLTEVSELYDETAPEYTDGSLFWAMSELYALCCEDRANCGEGVKSYFEKYQQSLIDQQAAVDKEMTELAKKGDAKALAEAANALNSWLTEQLYDMAHSVLAELEAYVAAGDTSAPFEPTAAKNGVMPAYSLAEALKPHFTDVPAWAKEAVDWAVEHDITNGTGAKTFSPATKCTDQMSLTFIQRQQNGGVKDGDFDGAIVWAEAQKLVEAGEVDNKSECTRAKAVTYLWKLAGSPEAKLAEGQFKDVAVDADCAAAVAWAVENAITNGDGGADIFNPDGVCTRAQIVTFLMRYAGMDG